MHLYRFKKEKLFIHRFMKLIFFYNIYYLIYIIYLKQNDKNKYRYKILN